VPFNTQYGSYIRVQRYLMTSCPTCAYVHGYDSLTETSAYKLTILLLWS